MALNRSESIRAALEEKSLERGTTMKGRQRQRTGQTTDKFLRAIQKYAKKQNSAMRGEVKQLKTERLKEAEERGKRDSARLIAEKNQEIRSRHTALLATKTQEGQRRLFVERSRMVEEIFAEAEKKLSDYTATDDYTERLLCDARKMAELFGGKACVISVCERDLSASDDLKAIFGEGTVVKPDRSIRIGGLRGYCESVGVLADETLDTKLEAQREWFIENASLSVL